MLLNIPCIFYSLENLQKFLSANPMDKNRFYTKLSSDQKQGTILEKMEKKMAIKENDENYFFIIQSRSMTVRLSVP